MARPPKTGLDFFFIDVDITEDDRVVFVEEKYGVEAFGILIKLLREIYHRNGYYLPWRERDQYAFLKQTPGVDINRLREVVSAYINEGFFHPSLAKTHEILTSHGIQKRYVMACERRKHILLTKEWCLIRIGCEDFVTTNIRLTSINVNTNPPTDGISDDMTDTEKLQRRQREEREKKEKETESIGNSPDLLEQLITVGEGKDRRNGYRKWFDKLCQVYPKKTKLIFAEQPFYSLMDSGVFTPGFVRDHLIPGVEKLSRTTAWTCKNGQLVPSLENFLDQDRWKAELAKVEEDDSWPVR